MNWTIARSLSAVILTLFIAHESNGQIYTVSNANDAGAGSLRAAITAMNAAGISPAQINFTAGAAGVISLSSPLPDIQVSARINILGALGIVLDGTSAGATHGLRFRENTMHQAGVFLLTIQNFQQSGVIVNPLNNNEQVFVQDCIIQNCGGDGVEIPSSGGHTVVDSATIDNGGWGVKVTNGSADDTAVVNSFVVGNSVGGIQLVGSNHFVGGCFIVQNGSSESSDHRGGVVYGSTVSSATGCNTVSCTLAGNTPYGVKMTSASVGEVRGNETYSNTQAGIRALGTRPTVTLGRFIIDTVNNQVILRTAATGPANTSLDMEFFVALVSGSDEGSAYLDSADLNVSLDGSGATNFYHKFSRAATFFGEAAQPAPVNFQISNSDRLTATATSASLGTSEFSVVGTVALAGDFDLNGSVDGSDFLTWQRNVGNADPEYWEGDADFDGDVDGADLAIWQANFGLTP